MARSFNGTTDFATVSSALEDFAAFSLLTVAFWLWWDTNANDDDFACEYGASFLTNSGFVVDHNSSSGGGGGVEFGMGLSAGNSRWTDKFTRPSAAAWHHYVYVMRRATPVNKAWVDGAAQTLTTVTHNAGTYGNFGVGSMFLMCRTGPTLNGAGRMDDWAVWGGVELTQAEIDALAAGVRPSLIRPLARSRDVPFYESSSPQQDVCTGVPLTLTGTAAISPPGKLGVPAARLAVAA